VDFIHDVPFRFTGSIDKLIDWLGPSQMSDTLADLVGMLGAPTPAKKQYPQAISEVIHQNRNI